MNISTVLRARELKIGLKRSANQTTIDFHFVFYKIKKKIKFFLKCFFSSGNFNCYNLSKMLKVPADGSKIVNKFKTLKFNNYDVKILTQMR